jgi:uncharacterized protein (TIGR03083 family)
VAERPGAEIDERASGMDEHQDLAAEQGALESVVSGLDRGMVDTDGGGGLGRPGDDRPRGLLRRHRSPRHRRPAGFAELLDRAVRAGFDVPAAHAHFSGPEVFAWWQEARAGLLAALRPLDPKDRIAWFGPPMSARSFATARLMETWSHGWDVAEALGRPDPPTDRLRHVAHLGVVTRGWSYAVRGRPAPEGRCGGARGRPRAGGRGDPTAYPTSSAASHWTSASRSRSGGRSTPRRWRSPGRWRGVDGPRAGLRGRRHHDRPGPLRT